MAPDRPADVSAAIDVLTHHSGCDETLLARNPESTIVLVVRVPGVLNRAWGRELPYQEEVNVGSSRIDVRIEQGADLDHWCTDILNRPPRIDASWMGVDGTATVSIIERAQRARGDQQASPRMPTTARVRFEELVLTRRDSTGETWTIPEFLVEATIGEPAGG